MSIKMNRDAYEKLIEGNVAWLREQPDTLERAHIESVLWNSIEHYYPDVSDTVRVPRDKP